MNLIRDICSSLYNEIRKKKEYDRITCNIDKKY